MEIGFTLLPFVLLSIILVLANLARHSPAFAWLAYGALVVVNLLMLNAGVASLAPQSELLAIPPQAEPALDALLRGVGITGLVAFLPLLPSVRRGLARLIPVDPASPVHTTALVYAVYVVGLGISQQRLLSDPAVVQSLELRLTSALAWSQALGMVLLAVSGVGLFVSRSPREVAERLGLAWPTFGHAVVAGLAVIFLFGAQVTVALIWRSLDPAGFDQLSNASNLLFGEFSGPVAAFTLGFTAAVGEELVFRGALQPRFGLLLPAVLFTVLHSQYGFSPATLLILMIALVLGVLRWRTNLTVCILTHFGYNFVTVMLASLVQ